MNKENKSIKIAVTGGMGSGKSAAGEYLKGKGFAVYDCDETARAVADRQDVKEAVLDAFGQEFFKDGVLDRKALGAYVFADAARTERLNAIFHTAVIDEVKAVLARVKGVVFVIVPLLFESNMEKMFDLTWLIAADESVQASRVAARDGMSLEDIKNRLSRQMPLQEKMKRADVVICNNSDESGLYAQIDRALSGLAL